MPIALAARDAGYEVHIATRSGTIDEVEQLNQELLQFHPISFHRSSTGLWQELETLRELHRLYKEIQPDIVHHVTIKPVLYGTLVARWVGGIQILNAISGLGYLFIAQGWKSSIRKKSYYGDIGQYSIVKKSGYCFKIRTIKLYLPSIKLSIQNMHLKSRALG